MEQERYELPDGWEWKKLSVIAPPSRQTLLPVSDQQYNYIGLEHIVPNSAKLTDFSPVDGQTIASTKNIFSRNMVLFGKLRPYLRKVHVAQFDGIASTEIIPFQCTADILPEYLAHFMRSDFFINLAVDNCSGSRMPRVTTRFLQTLAFIPLPPLPEQRRIADKLDAVLGRIDDAIRLSQDNLASLDDLFASMLQQAFNPLGKTSKETRYELPDGWEWKKLSDILVLHYGKALKTSDRVGGNIKVYGSNGVIDTHNDFLCSYPTVIIGRKGSVGETNLCTDSCWVIDTAFFTEIKDKTKLCLKYFFYFTKTNNVHRLTQNGVKPGINRNDYLNQSIPLPPLPEQRRIADKLDALSGKIALQKRAIEKKLDELNHLKSSVLDAAFRGRL